jgi:aspartate aminotransferase-like enzyme
MLEESLTMTPGPTPVHPRILEALARPTMAHGAPAFVEAFRVALADFQALCRTGTGQPFAVSGGGTLAMEMAVVNLVAPGERLLVVSHGHFGDRFRELAGSFGIHAEVLAAPWGRAAAPEELARALAGGPFKAVTVTHVDTSTGTAAPVADYAEILRGRPELVILDGVCATGGMDERFDEWGVDVLLTAPQKAIGAPPGLALCAFSQRAMEVRRAMPAVPAYYADVLRWLPVMADPAKYFSTPCVNGILALAEALRLLHQEGIQERFARHGRLARAMRAGLEVLGLAPFTAAGCRADTLSVVLLPPGVEEQALRGQVAARGVAVAGGLGPLAGKALRIGHMGNIAAGEVAQTLLALEGALTALGHPTLQGGALAAAGPWL